MRGAGEGDCVIECCVLTAESSIPDYKNTQSSLTKASRDGFPLLHGAPPEGVESCGTSAASWWGPVLRPGVQDFPGREGNTPAAPGVKNSQVQVDKYRRKLIFVSVIPIVFQVVLRNNLYSFLLFLF